jgi:hypothetical protein
VTETDGTAEVETVTITLADGRCLSETVRHARGSPAEPLSRADLEDKLRGSASGAFGDRTSALANACDRFEALPSVADLTALLASPS